MTPRFSTPENPQIMTESLAIPKKRLKRLAGRAAITALAGTGLVTASVGTEIWEAKPATAAETTYTDGDAYDCSANFGIYAWCKGGSWLSPRGFAYRNCTDWAAFRINQLTGATVPADLGNATTWDDHAVGRFSVDNSPEQGDAAVWDGNANNPYGHVAVVEAINPDGTVNISEYNQTGQGHFGEQMSVTANHYIDFNGPNTPPQATTTDLQAFHNLLNYLWTQSGGASIAQWF